MTPADGNNVSRVRMLRDGGFLVLGRGPIVVPQLTGANPSQDI